MAQVCLLQINIIEVCIQSLDAMQLAPLQIAIQQRCLREICTAEVGVPKLCMQDAGIAEKTILGLGTEEISTEKLRLLEGTLR